MKTRNLQSSLLAIAAVTALAFMADNVAAQDSTAAIAPPVAASQPAPQLSYGVPQVLQLVQAKVSDGIIVSYIQNSGTIYSLKADEIVYLKQAGVSDPVLNAMLAQRSRLTGSTEPAATTASSPAASVQTDTPAPTPAELPAPTTPAPAVTYVQTAPPSTVYVVPEAQAYPYDPLYYGAYPYYGYYGAPYPALSFSFGFGDRGGGFRGGGFNGGWRHR